LTIEAKTNISKIYYTRKLVFILGRSYKVRVKITGRHIEVSDALKEYLNKKLEHVRKYFDSIIDANIILSVEKYRHVAEVTINVNGMTLHGEEETGDMYSSIDKVFDKIEKQLKKHRDKLTTKHHKASPNKSLKMKVDVLSGEDVEQFSESPRVIRTKEFAIKPMDIEEVIVQMDLLNQNILVFTNSRTNRINVIYRRDDGNYGLIEPDYA